MDSPSMESLSAVEQSTLDFLGGEPPEKAPPRSKGRGGDHRPRIAEVVLLNHKEGKSTTLRELREAVGHRVNNAIGTLIGQGVGGEGGMGLWRDPCGSDVVVCRQNAQLCAMALGHALSAFVANDLGMTREGFRAWIAELPLARKFA